MDIHSHHSFNPVIVCWIKKGLLKMEEMVRSAIVHETVNKVMSGLLDKYEQKSSGEDRLERLEMAQIKLEFALETSNKWQITSGPLLRWQKKLKRAAEECDDTLRKCRQRVQEEEEAKQQVRNSSFPRWIASATKSLISSIVHGNIDEPSRSVVRRFEWFADGANDFLRYVESGGTPRRYLFFDPLIGHLLAGKRLEYKLLQGNRQHLFWIRPNNIAERGVEAMLIFFYRDCSAPEDNFFLGMMLQLSESLNIIGTTLKCLQLFTPHFKSTTETVRKELTQLPTQDFSWVPHAHAHSYLWDNIHNITTGWYRPNPLCCKHHGQKVCGSENMDKIELPADVSLEPVIQVNLVCQVSLPRFGKQGPIAEGKELPHLNVLLLYTPHGSSEDLSPAVENTVTEVINGDEQHLLHTNIPLEQMEEMMLPRAVDCFHQNAKATAYQMLWKSKHGGAYLHAVKATMNMPSTRRTIRGARKPKMLQQHDHRTQRHTNGVADFLKAAHAPVQLHGSYLGWIQKEKEAQLTTIEEIHELVRLGGLNAQVELQPNVRDDITWKLTANGTYTAASAYQFQFHGSYSTTNFTKIWEICMLTTKTATKTATKENKRPGVIGENILMSEVIGSAVIGEAVSRISTFVIDNHNRKSIDEDGLERLEMSHIRMEAALEMSNKYPPATDTSLLRWRKKLKRASDECSHVMDRCKRRAMEDKKREQEIRQFSFPKRIAHATRSFFSFDGNKDIDSLITTSTIQRFERFADGASEFLRFMEFGSIGSINYMLVDPLTGHLLAGKALQYENSHGSQYYLASRPMHFAERGQEAGVLLRYDNHERPEENFILAMLLRLSASTNVIGIVARCLELLPPNFKPVAEAAKQELTLVHQRALYCFPFVDSTDPEYSQIHRLETHRARPNPACCEELEHHGWDRSSGMLEPSGAFPEPVIKLFVQRYVSPGQDPSSSSSSSGYASEMVFSGHSGSPLLQLTAVFAPHASREQLPSGAKSAAVVAIDGIEEQSVRTNVGLREVEELLLPSAVDCLFHKAVDGSSAHEAFWRSGHGVAYLCVEKMGTEIAKCRPTQWRV
uniref:Uncharacterized protein n=1 Tax=Leersia perrieri TaxID=77586 RepID=A0A0D9WV11_9ORYZ